MTAPFRDDEDDVEPARVPVEPAPPFFGVGHKAPEIKDIVREGFDELMVSLRDILSTLPDELDAKKGMYADLVKGLAGDVLAGRITFDQAKYEAKQIGNSLTQAIGSAGLDITRRQRDALDAAVAAGFKILLRIATTVLA